MLTSCPACHQSVSPNAHACPHCGEPFQAAATAARPGMLDTAYAVFAGLLLVIGLVLTGLGGLGMASYSSPAEEVQTQIEASGAAGHHVNTADAAAASAAGVIRTEEKLQSSKLLLSVGGVCAIPFLMLVATRGARRSRRSAPPVPAGTAVTPATPGQAGHTQPPPATPVQPAPPAPPVKITLTRRP